MSLSFFGLLSRSSSSSLFTTFVTSGWLIVPSIDIRSWSDIPTMRRPSGAREVFTSGSDTRPSRMRWKWVFIERHLYHSSAQLAAMRRIMRKIKTMVPILTTLTKSRPRSSTTEVSIWSQKVTVFWLGSGSAVTSNERPPNVSLISFFNSSKGVSTLSTFVRNKWDEQLTAYLHGLNLSLQVRGRRNRVVEALKTVTDRRRQRKIPQTLQA